MKKRKKKKSVKRLHRGSNAMTVTIFGNDAKVRLKSWNTRTFWKKTGSIPEVLEELGKFLTEKGILVIKDEKKKRNKNIKII